jgi:hypothetical protein
LWMRRWTFGFWRHGVRIRSGPKSHWSGRNSADLQCARVTCSGLWRIWRRTNLLQNDLYL